MTSKYETRKFDYKSNLFTCHDKCILHQKNQVALTSLEHDVLILADLIVSLTPANLQPERGLVEN